MFGKGTTINDLGMGPEEIESVERWTNGLTEGTKSIVSFLDGPLAWRLKFESTVLITFAFDLKI